MGKVLQVDTSTGGGDLHKDFGSNHTGDIWISLDVAMNAIARTGLEALSGSCAFLQIDSHTFQDTGAEWYVDTGVAEWAGWNDANDPASTPTASPSIATMQFYRLTMHMQTGSPITQAITVGGGDIGTMTVTGANSVDARYLDIFQPGITSAAGGYLYFDNIKVGTTQGATDIFGDDFEGGNLSSWTSADSVFSVIDDPGINPAGTVTPAGIGKAGLAAFGASSIPGNTFVKAGTGKSGAVASGPQFVPGAPSANAGRVLIAWNDGPLEPNPTWTRIDDPTGVTFPKQFVAGYDTKNGRQTLISQTDTGTATVYINDHELGLFDDRNTGSPYFGKLSGRQIMLQLYDPVTATWQTQFRGLIDGYSYDIDGSASDANGDPINASIQIECVDMFDYLEGFGLTPGLAGIDPQPLPGGGTAGGAVPAGMEDGVYYAPTAGTVQDRIIEVLADAHVDYTRYLVASGNTRVIGVKYDPGESALTALRDAADAEFPFIANIYVNRHGDFQFRGRYSRFTPDDVAAEPSSDWDFTRWAVGDETAILSDPTRAQMRALQFARTRSNIINVAMCWPQNLQAADMPDQVFADTSSITAYGQHSAPPMSDLLTDTYAGPGTISPNTGKHQCFLFAKLLVKNQAFPREAITALQVKSMDPNDYRAEATWAFITKSDISHIVNVAVGYPGGTGFTGSSPRDDYYIEGRSLTVRPLHPDYDYVEYDIEVSPAVWSMDTDSVFPAFGS